MPDMTLKAHGAHHIAPDIHGQNFWAIDRQFQDLLSLYMEPALLKRYRAAYARHFELWKAAGQRYGVTLARVPSAPDLSAALQLEALRNGAVEPWA